MNIEKLKPRKFKNFKYRYQSVAWIMLAPMLLLLLVFVLVPLGLSLVRSFQDSVTGEFVWFKNYWSILQLSSFVKSFQNIAFFVITIVPLQLMFSLAFAMLLTKLTQKISAAIRTIIYIPVLLSGIVASIIFLLLLNFGGGLITSILYSLNLDAISFATDPFWARVIVIIPTLWLCFGYNTLVLYAGLMNVPKTYYEAASIDGAGAWTKLFKITLPQMKVYFVLLIINLVTTTLQMYEIPMMMTEGGPLESTLTPVLFLMANHNGDRPTNVVIAGALIVMLIIMLINTFVFKSMKSNKSEDS